MELIAANLVTWWLGSDMYNPHQHAVRQSLSAVIRLYDIHSLIWSGVAAWLGSATAVVVVIVATNSFICYRNCRLFVALVAFFNFFVFLCGAITFLMCPSVFVSIFVCVHVGFALQFCFGGCDVYQCGTGLTSNFAVNVFIFFRFLFLHFISIFVFVIYLYFYIHKIFSSPVCVFSCSICFCYASNFSNLYIFIFLFPFPSSFNILHPCRCLSPAKAQSSKHTYMQLHVA